MSGSISNLETMKPYYHTDLMTLYHNNVLNVLPALPDASIDAIVSDPPYPEVSRDYGRMTEFEWSVMMVEVCKQAQRILKPTGSAVFILQPNSKKVGSMRGWLWEFMAWVCREWNMVQDVWWWNIAAMPSGHGIHRDQGLLKASVKACVWCGPADCYRDQDAVLWELSDTTKAQAAASRATNKLIYSPSGIHKRTKRMLQIATDRGGSISPNLLPMANANSVSSAGAYGHGAGTPLPLADWWTRYIVPPKSTVLDCFVGAGTMGIAALLHGHKFIGIDKELEYLNITIERCKDLERQRRGEWAIAPRRTKRKKTDEYQTSLFETWDLE